MIRFKPVILGGVAVLIAGTAAIWMLTNRPGARQTPIHVTSGLPAPNSPRAEGSDQRAPALAEQKAAPLTTRDFLAAYWGPQWTRIEQEMLKQGLDLDGPYEFKPWESVSEEFRSLFEYPAEKVEKRREQKIGWPIVLTSEWLVQRFPVAARDERVIGDREVAEIESLTADVHSRLYETFDEWGTSMADALESTWKSGAFVKAPFSTFGVPRLREGRAFHAGAKSGRGWSVRVQLYSEDFPGIESLVREMATMRRERDLMVMNYLKKL